ncbi:MAG: CDP-diacylglycerol--glycerol-3-phosphate 3-phosphatidyltransferase [Rhodospirillaceae bacterium]
MRLNLPNILTLARIAAIPPAVALCFMQSAAADWILLALFLAAAVTDWLDGHLARLWREESPFGRFLDPIADKLLVLALLFMLAATGRLPDYSVIPALVILLREILISGLREFLAGIRVSLPVSRLAKWKTAVQMVAIALLIVGRHGAELLPVPLDQVPLDQVGALALWLAALMTAITGVDYMRLGLRHMGSQHGP